MEIASQTPALWTPRSIVVHAARHALGHELFSEFRSLSLSGIGLETEVSVEIEFYCSAKACAASRDDPGWPAEYEVAAVHVVEFPKLSTGFRSTQAARLETPDWLAAHLIYAVDVATLSENP